MKISLKVYFSRISIILPNIIFPKKCTFREICFWKDNASVCTYFYFTEGNTMKLKSRLLSAVLTLALLCPMLAVLMPLDASAALIPNDGSAEISANYVYEEWNFDDLADGEAISAAYMNSHSRGYLEATDAHYKAGQIKAVKDGDKTYAQVTGDGAYFIFDDPRLVLANNVYEVEYDVRVSGDALYNTPLAWTGDDGTASLLRWNTSGSGKQFGYKVLNSNGVEGDSFQATADPDVWNNFRVRIDPVKGYVMTWLNGELVFTYTHFNLAELAKDSETSNLRLWYQWIEGQQADIDNIRITTNVKIDEHLTFDIPEAADEASGSWDFTGDSISNGANVTATKGDGSSYAKSPTDATNSVLSISDNDKEGHVCGTVLTLADSWYGYDEIELSFDLYYDSVSENRANNWANLFRYLYSGTGTYKALFRVPAVASATTESVTINSRASAESDATTSTGLKLLMNKWNSIKIEIVPMTGGVKLTLNGESYSFTNSGIKQLYDRGAAVKIMPYYHVDINNAAYIDNLSIKATPAKVFALSSSLAGKWNDPSFTVNTPSVGGMEIGDYEIGESPETAPVNIKWTFDSGKMPAATGMTVSSGGNWSYGTIGNDTVNKMWASYTTTTGADFPTITMPGLASDYETIDISWDMRVASLENYANVFCVYMPGSDNKYGDYGKNKLRIHPMAKASTTTSAKAAVGDNGGPSIGMVTRNKWHTFRIKITMATGDISFWLDGVKADISATNNYYTTFKNNMKKLYDDGSQFKLRLYRASGCASEVYIDNLSINAEHTQAYKQNANSSYVEGAPNGVIKTLTDTNGNRRSTLAIKDSELYLTKQPFEISFDYRLAAKPSGDLNLLRFDMNGTVFSVLRLTSGAGVCHYGTGQKHYTPNVAGITTLSLGQWYNFRTVLDPTTGHCTVYLDNKLISDYNINDVYHDKSVFDNATKMLIEISNQYSSSITQDHAIDNLRIRTLDKEKMEKYEYADADFENASGTLDAAGFSKALGGMYTTALDGDFSVQGELNKYLNAKVKAGNGIDVRLNSAAYNPFAASVMSFEGIYTLKAAGADRINLMSIGHVDAYLDENSGTDERVSSLLTVNADGMLSFCGVEEICKLEVGVPTKIKVVYSGIGGLVSLYVNGKLESEIAQTISHANIGYVDGMGNDIYPGADSFASYIVSSDEDYYTTLSGDLYRAEAPTYKNAAYPTDTLKLFCAEGEGEWEIALDDFKVKRDESETLFFAPEYEAEGETVSNAVIAFRNGEILGKSFVVETDADVAAVGITPVVSMNCSTDGETEKLDILYVDGDGYLYGEDGETKLSDTPYLANKCKLAVAISTSTWRKWETIAVSDDYVIDVTVYVDGAAVGSYSIDNVKKLGSLITLDGSSSTTSSFKNTRIYFGNSLRSFGGGDDSEVKFEGYNAVTIDFEDESWFIKAENNVIDYLDWSFSDRGTKMTDNDSASVTLVESITEGENTYLQVRRPCAPSKPLAYMEYNLGALGEFGSLYTFELELKYTDTLGSSLTVAELYGENLSSKTELLSVLGASDTNANGFYFINDGIRYFLCDKSGAPLTAKPAGGSEFSRVSVLVNAAEGYYTLYIDGQCAYYYGEGGNSGAVTSCAKLPLEFNKNDAYTICDPVLRLVDCSDNEASNSIVAVDNISIDIIKHGMAPVMLDAVQYNELGNAIRFVATVDTLYTSAVGFDVEILSEKEGEVTKSAESNLVFSSFEADGETIVAGEHEDVEGRYVMLVSVNNLDVDTYVFTVTPYVIVYGEKISGQAQSFTYNHIIPEE